MPPIQRVTVFAPDIPYPDNRGGRADVWRRILALRRLGVGVQLVCFYDDLDGKRPTEAHRQHVLGVVDALEAYPITKGRAVTLQRLPRILAKPWHVVCRSLHPTLQSTLHKRVQEFAPDVLWCEGVWMGATAQAAATRLRLPLVYRSHNIEHLYMPRQAAVAQRLRDRIAWTVACFGLERFERRMLSRAAWVFDISNDDMAFWQAQGIHRISWLPPVAEAALTPPPPAPARHDVLFLGNLTTPNNVRGVQWLVQEIWPLVLAARPGTQLLVAGSNPGPFIRQVCSAPGVTLMPNVPDALALYASARVLVNPVRTGSGTHIKAIEMLMMQAPIVTATQGTQGLPEAVKSLFTVADTAADFAAAIVRELLPSAGPAPNRAMAHRLFGVDGLAEAMSGLQARLAAPSDATPPDAKPAAHAAGRDRV